MGMRSGESKKLSDTGRVLREVVINSREEAAACMEKVVRRTVMVSSARQVRLRSAWCWCLKWRKVSDGKDKQSLENIDLIMAFRVLAAANPFPSSVCCLENSAGNQIMYH